MANTGAHLVDRVLPDVPLRQYVLSLPQELRMLAAFKPAVLGALGRLFVAAIFAHYRKRARSAGLPRPQCGAVTFVQRGHVRAALRGKPQSQRALSCCRDGWCVHARSSFECALSSS